MKSKNIIKKTYEKLTPFIQMAGWIIIATTTLYTAISGFDKVIAYDKRISAVEQIQSEYRDKINKIDNKLEDIMQFWRIPHQRSDQ